MRSHIDFGRLVAIFTAVVVLAWLTVPGGLPIALAVGAGLTAAVVGIDLWGAYRPGRYLDRLLERLLGWLPIWVRIPLALVVMSALNYRVDGRHVGSAVGTTAVIIVFVLAVRWWDQYRGRRAASLRTRQS